MALDYNGDGFVDIAFVNDAANAVQIMHGTLGLYTWSVCGLRRARSRTTSLWVISTATGSRYGGVVFRWWRNSVRADEHRQRCVNASLATTGARQIAVADFNSDGRWIFMGDVRAGQGNQYLLW